MLESEGLSLITFNPLTGGYLADKYRDGARSGRRAMIQFPPVDETRGAQLLSVMDASTLPFEYPGWMIANDSDNRRKLLETGIAEQTTLPRQ